MSAANIPNNAITVEATGQVMTASLKGLDSESQYCFVAFVTTTEGETFYGEQQMFTISRNMTDIYEEAVGQQAVVVDYYDMNGRCIESPKRGLNILRMSDGTTRKVMIK